MKLDRRAAHRYHRVGRFRCDEGARPIMVQHRPTSDAARRAVQRRRREDEDDEAMLLRGATQGVRLAGSLERQGELGRRCSVIGGGNVDDCPASAPASRWYLIGSRGEAGCPLCTRRSRRVTTTAGSARTSCQFLAVTWVVLTVGEPLPSPL